METQSHFHQTGSKPHFVEAAQEAVNNPEVVEAMKTLSKYGLGVCLPHMHSETGEFEPLPSDRVQVEADLQVSFEKLDSPKLEKTIPVGWIWNEDVHVLMCCQWLGGRVCSSKE